jgi:gliding motility-associated-like protein
MKQRTGKRLLMIILLSAFSLKLTAQTPATCFEIESILVAACGSPEGENEMVRFIVGPNTLNIVDLNVSWPNGGNPYRGICENAATAAKVAAINATIVSCGLVLEPPAGDLPPGAKVILATSTDISVSANSFSSLSDTIYMIFQCAGNTTGHFKNYGPSSLGSRTLEMDFGPGCSDVVSYFPYQLVTQNGVQGDQVGSFVNFTASGSASYGNDGCQAIIQIPSIQAQAAQTVVCPGDTINVTANLQNFSLSGSLWSGGSGTFINPTSLNTQYIVGPSDVGDFPLYIIASGNCGAFIGDTITLTLNGDIIASLQTDPLAPYCMGDVVKLIAAGGDQYQWSNGATASNIQVLENGTYIVTVSNACFSQIDSVDITFSEVEANFTATPTSGLAPFPVTFSDESSSNATNWNWDFGDGFTSTEQNTTHIYNTAGLFPVTLRVTNIDGCISYAYSEITVTGDTVTFIPNAFSPNTDTKNEMFIPVGSNVFNTTGIIYNRWGGVVHQWENSEGWNGTDTKGNKAAEGIYIYDVRSTYVWGKTIRYKGWVMLVR